MYVAYFLKHQSTHITHKYVYTEHSPSDSGGKCTAKHIQSFYVRSQSVQWDIHNMYQLKYWNERYMPCWSTLEYIHVLQYYVDQRKQHYLSPLLAYRTTQTRRPRLFTFHPSTGGLRIINIIWTFGGLLESHMWPTVSTLHVAWNGP